jgi:ATPase subunit of ABC transporter with duplicated ATPase domains
MYVGNYEFWYESSQLVQRVLKQQNKRNEEKIRELQAFISRFSANKSKARQATSRRNLLEKLSVFDMPASSRRYPFIGFDMDREPGKDILMVKNLSAEVDGEVLFSDLSFMLSKNDKVAFVGNDRSITALFRVLMEEQEPAGGEFKWGVSITKSYFPRDNTPYFDGCTDSILDWMRQYSSDQTESYLRNFLGRMLFSGDSVFKEVQVLSGGEKVRCMFSRMMLFGSNALLLDQPTNHLDLESITAVNNGLSDFKGNILFSSHDYEIVNTVANRIIEITPDGWQDFHGTYEEFVEAQKKKGVTNISL